MNVTGQTVRSLLFAFAWSGRETEGEQATERLANRRSTLGSAFSITPFVRGLCGTLAVLAVTVLAPLPALAAKYAAIVVDARTGEVLHEENADTLTYPASLTKMMTLYLTFDALDSGRLRLDQALPVSAWAEAQSPTKLGLRAGKTLRVEQAILGLVTKSANDASVVLAEALGGSEAKFAEMMTRKARELGMRNTVFRNSNGLPNMEQLTTARDFSILSRAMLSDHSRYYPYFSRRAFVYGGRSLNNHNRLMSRYEGMDGIKTGYTVASGFNLAASAVRDGRRLVAVVLGGKSAASRDARMEAILDKAFDKPSRGSEAPVVARAGGEDAPRVTAKGKPPAKPETIAQLASTVSTPAAVRPPVRARDEDADGSKWGVQVGAFSTREASKRALTQATKQAPFLLRAAKPAVTPVKANGSTVYRARMVGLDEGTARKVCSELTRSGHRCVPVSPNEKL
ncbi:D-alanyl-D-alanine carboxypeptidase [Azospirillum formosense]|uniref:D-alanyl-D-alanine carboxypeptidase n=1 Tax=Azospirillum formosense TaxID=861533 RepID=A0ABX2LB93_9PROT|nr:D-alanyl-D-alanine carboxypeptidase family protein [Azospirillum formosense]MBY3752340.1 D-alanyl-D-alanine carboxypeptidase [Azospirillum formosense]NUB22560.1 D-alanyl-D-alanine carboxypeptidase [Azospirillum formosense]